MRTCPQFFRSQLLKIFKIKLKLVSAVKFQLFPHGFITFQQHRLNRFD